MVPDSPKAKFKKLEDESTTQVKRATDEVQSGDFGLSSEVDVWVADCEPHARGCTLNRTARAFAASRREL
jgi:hypothetical protein